MVSNGIVFGGMVGLALLENPTSSHDTNKMCSVHY